ncbi:MAG: nucleoside 2-deoxyribosyltransferase [Candidatus Woesearchaeota archaeon]
MGLDKLPSIISKTNWNENGLARTKSGMLVPAYIANQFGFSTSGKELLDKFYNRLENEAGILPLCPFSACEEFFDKKRLGSLKTIDEQLAFWDEFNRIVGRVNYEVLMPKSKLMIAILDGSHSLDDGVAAEIGFYAAEYKGKKPIVGIRSDFRLSENPAAPINIAVRYFIDRGPYNGFFFNGPDAYDKAVRRIKELADKIRATP